MHLAVHEDWTTPEFDDSAWPAATAYRASAVTRQAAYRDYADSFGDAQFIWSHNLNQDNPVPCRAQLAGRTPDSPLTGCCGTIRAI